MQKLECNENVVISDIGRQFTKFVIIIGMHHWQSMGRLLTYKQNINPFTGYDLIPQSEAPQKKYVSSDQYRQKCNNQWFATALPIGPMD